MTYCIVHTFTGATKDQYEAAVAAVHPEDGGLPKGQMYHVAGPSANGWTIVAVHDSRESWELFRDSILMPRMSEGIAGGFAGPPDDEIAFDVDTEVRA